MNQPKGPKRDYFLSLKTSKHEVVVIYEVFKLTGDIKERQLSSKTLHNAYEALQYLNPLHVITRRDIFNIPEQELPK